ncbi:hypothetical protein PSN45_003768 [Yamadazyma tenuis]|uniref:FIST domain-containing protein n=1 Tax=Candida tenuis (strain ATCC 10573 / BCRC 21748 / CBS 615 / JCM 9827 / NBRC 10315 / NRRL Y-1498 / VKM Y-70) TaxID=590646 RepID=G3B3B9_CANTC|nr:uncharacterized protein CANTEDRAFT_114154 [Yamadazyma tenuis ATCC 10573]EGV64132.1 hypothetical protein CANTEDRAFT_114154 [Yamadazyma tenuis ATCC 10573]WEJ96232.1 hypothetical protein PSN45_003768 [Yamadazyma tenuis]
MYTHIRHFRSSSRLCDSFWKTVVHPTTSLIPHPQFAPKSVILLSTPSNLPAVTQQAIELYDSKVQVIVAGIDTIKGSRNGVSALWLDSHLDISGVLYQEAMTKNWKKTDSNLQLNFSKNSIHLPLANSLFSTGNLITLFHLDPRGSPFHDKLLKSISINLPDEVIRPSLIDIQDRWTPLFDEPMYVTNCIGNLIKSINNKSAAKFLETNSKLMSLKSKETEVYVKLTQTTNGEPMENRFQVIAGGGGWGPKADTIVISPDAKVAKKDQVEFFMLTPEDKTRPLQMQDFGGFEFECSVPETDYTVDDGEEQVFDSFGCGSEAGFKHNSTNHKSPGERVSFRI